MTQSTTRRSGAQIAAILLAVVVQIGATFLPQLGYGEPIGSRSDDVETLITPAGWAFAIWGPLFFGSAVYAIWQALPGQRDNALLDAIAWPSVVGLSSQGVWATYTQFADLTWISAVIILTSLAGLLVVLRTLVHFERDFTLAERVIVGVTFGALVAWLTAASIVNITAALTFHGVGDGQDAALTAGLVLVGGIIASLATVRSRGNPWYAAVFCWALLAIYFRGGQEANLVGYACIAAAVLVIAACIAGLRNPANRRRWFG